MTRRGFFRRALAFLAGAPPVAAVLSACGRDGMPEGMPDWMMSRGMDARLMSDMPVIHDLLVDHARIERPPHPAACRARRLGVRRRGHGPGDAADAAAAGIPG
ncbi:MAG: hypothetical protein WD249_05470 [Gaiellaceae bacterium]